MPGPSTRAVHAGEGDPVGSVNTPIHQTTTYRYPENPDGSHAARIYTRYHNPTVDAVEEKVAALEGSKHALLFASGMAATACVATAFLSAGDTVAVQRGVYGGTTAYFADEVARMGVTVHFFDAFSEPELPVSTKLVWLESISNPLLRVADIPAWAEVAKRAGAILCVDATFATPILQRPLELGADIVMHSASKYLGGHSDIMGGALAFNDHRENLWERRRNLGGIMDPHAAYLLARGMKTLAIRVERAGQNAQALADVAREWGIPTFHPESPLLDGPCGMLTIDLGSKEKAIAFRRSLQTMTPAASLGGVETLVSLPMETSHAYASDANRRADGITDGLVRISVGIEDLEDLVEDLRRAA